MFRLFMWGLAFSSLAAIYTKYKWHRPVDVPVHYLLICAMVSAVLAVAWLLLLTRLRKVSFHGVELELGVQAETDRLRRLLGPVPPDEPDPGPDPTEGQCQQFPMTKMSPGAQYEYEKLSVRLYVLLDRVDAATLDRENRNYIRELIRYVGKSAMRMGHFTKSLDVLKRLKDFSEDGNIEFGEMKRLGAAYILAGSDEPDKKKEYLREASELFGAAVRERLDDAGAQYRLGWVLLDENPGRAMEHLRESVRLNEAFKPWAYWTLPWPTPNALSGRKLWRHSNRYPAAVGGKG
ncbi:MAG TPA: hypothetical protein VN345_00925 [Blastocatellia bacterium]|nr:hypothetical protein [Blastocatellia bacterium]